MSGKPDSSNPRQMCDNSQPCLSDHTLEECHLTYWGFQEKERSRGTGQQRRCVGLYCQLLSWWVLQFGGVLLGWPKEEKMHAGTIEYVTTMDGTKYEFDKAPGVTNDRIVGQASLLQNGRTIKKDVSIPLAEVGTVRVREIDWMTTAGVAVSLVVVTGIVVYLVTMDQVHHDLWH